MYESFGIPLCHHCFICCSENNVLLEHGKLISSDWELLIMCDTCGRMFDFYQIISLMDGMIPTNMRRVGE